MGRALYGFVRGLLMGLLVGATLGMMVMCYLHRNRRGMKRHVGHALRTVGDLADSVLGMF
ncbi:MAG: hypothetical protein J6R77_04080 [Clostridia bacterium]|nr:hypothetical protein [Clostridia bacterium]